MDDGNVLMGASWFPCDNIAIVQNVVRESIGWVRNARCCIFPECGAAYHEWQAFIALRATGFRLDHIVLMDECIEELWKEQWLRLGRQHKTRVTIMPSYVALREWATLADTRREESSVVVVYVNGSIQFSAYACRQTNPTVSREAAVLFWDWCQEHAANAPVNFVRSSSLRPCACTTWAQLAETFRALGESAQR